MGLFSPDISSISSFYDQGKYLLAWRISIAFALIFMILTTLFAISSANAFLPASLVLVASLGCALYLKITKNYKPIFWAFVICGSLLAHFAMNYVLDFTHFVDFIWIITAILLAYIGLGWVYGMIFSFLNLIGLCLRELILFYLRI